MKYIGLDLGSRTLGVAISDALGMLARAYDTFRFNDDNYELAAKYTIDLAKKEGVTTIVLGYPRHMNGDAGIRASISDNFKKMLEEANLKVILEDERLTTVIVNKAMISGNVNRKDRKQKKDEMAAVVILQNYLDKISF
ncbi:MAG: Holliday junction resolvase RuvX [Acholeplasmatales bacterium]|nr:Holliday junction resolvase RuvX [Acholeplasmatales bacterium]